MPRADQTSRSLLSAVFELVPPDAMGRAAVKLADPADRALVTVSEFNVAAPEVLNVAAETDPVVEKEPADAALVTVSESKVAAPEVVSVSADTALVTVNESKVAAPVVLNVAAAMAPAVLNEPAVAAFVTVSEFKVAAPDVLKVAADTEPAVLKEPAEAALVTVSEFSVAAPEVDKVAAETAPVVLSEPTLAALVTVSEFKVAAPDVLNVAADIEPAVLKEPADAALVTVSEFSVAAPVVAIVVKLGSADTATEIEPAPFVTAMLEPADSVVATGSAPVDPINNWPSASKLELLSAPVLSASTSACSVSAPALSDATSFVLYSILPPLSVVTSRLNPELGKNSIDRENSARSTSFASMLIDRAGGPVPVVEMMTSSPPYNPSVRSGS